MIYLVTCVLNLSNMDIIRLSKLHVINDTFKNTEYSEDFSKWVKLSSGIKHARIKEIVVFYAYEFKEQQVFNQILFTYNTNTNSFHIMSIKLVDMLKYNTYNKSVKDFIEYFRVCIRRYFDLKETVVVNEMFIDSQEYSQYFKY